MGKVVGFYKKKGETRPITKGKHKTIFKGQTSESSWKKSSIQDVKRKKLAEAKLRIKKLEAIMKRLDGN